MRKGFLLAALLALAPLSALADDVSWGELTAPSVRYFGNSFDAPGTFSDSYSFLVTNAAAAGGLVISYDVSWLRNIQTTVSLFDGSTNYALPLLATLPLVAGTNYVLQITSVVTGLTGGLGDTVGYAGMMSLVASTGRTTSVPEPATVLIYAFGLAAVGFAVRKRPLARTVA